MFWVDINLYFLKHINKQYYLIIIIIIIIVILEHLKHLNTHTQTQICTNITVHTPDTKQNKTVLKEQIVNVERKDKVFKRNVTEVLSLTLSPCNNELQKTKWSLLYTRHQTLQKQ